MNNPPQSPQDASPQSQSIGMETVAIRVPFAEQSVYSNASAISMSEMDLRISFAEADQDKKARAIVSVIVPIEHAALLCLNLLNLLNNFERNSGQIRNRQWRQYIENQEVRTAITEAMMSKLGIPPSPGEPTETPSAPSPEGSSPPPASPEP
jgi:hypothetical protein